MYTIRTSEVCAIALNELANRTAAKRQHAGYKDSTLNDRYPLAEACQLLLHGDDHERPHDRPENGTETAD